MAAQTQGTTPISTRNPAPTANLDAQVGIVGSNGTDILEPDSSGRLTVKLQDGSGNVINSTTGRLHTTVSKDGAANAVNNAIFTQLSDGTAAISNTNPLPSGIYDGSGNLLGVSGNPLLVTTGGVSGTPKSDYEQTTSDTITKNGGTYNFDMAVTASLTYKMNKIAVGSNEQMHFDVIDDATAAEAGPTQVFTLYVAPASPFAQYEFKNPLEFAGGTAGTTLRITATNNGNKDSDASVFHEGTED